MVRPEESLDLPALLEAAVWFSDSVQTCLALCTVSHTTPWIPMLLQNFGCRCEISTLLQEMVERNRHVRSLGTLLIFVDLSYRMSYDMMIWYLEQWLLQTCCARSQVWHWCAGNPRASLECNMFFFLSNLRIGTSVFQTGWMLFRPVLEDKQCLQAEGVSKTMACCISAVLLALSRPYNVDSAHVTARGCNEASPNLRCVHNRMV